MAKEPKRDAVRSWFFALLPVTILATIIFVVVLFDTGVLNYNG